MESLGEAERAQARITQRELASRSGLSLGMTNALLRRFAEKGWVKLTRLSTKSIHYALTPEGVGEVARRTAGYFRRAARSAEQHRARLEQFVLRAKKDGARTLVLAGASELDFLLEFICDRHGLVFARTADEDLARAFASRPGVVILYAESATGGNEAQNAACLRDLLNAGPQVSGQR
ncbi:MAG: winged helix-turn-helix transcriptional regulator [Spirochaetia bacterium]